MQEKLLFTNVRITCSKVHKMGLFSELCRVCLIVDCYGEIFLRSATFIFIPELIDAFVTNIFEIIQHSLFGKIIACNSKVSFIFEKRIITRLNAICFKIYTFKSCIAFVL